KFLLTPDELEGVIEIVPFGRNETRDLSMEILCDIMQPRAVELMQHVARETSAAKAQISGGVFLTGGGATVRGLAEIAEQVFDAPTRVGFVDASYVGGLSEEVHGPQWATACGLALISMREQMRRGGSGGRSSAQRVAEWFGNIRGRFR
ncbi:MAG: hypothetical protein KBF83_12065, partial [Pyrinomonadaceae bacterium]|nr:hypothetical protein [Pyrinomonadaceae bacterium]